MTENFWIEVVKSVPVLVVAGYGALQGRRNGQKADRIEVASTTAAAKAETAVTKAEELHAATKQVVAQTNGNIESLMQELARVREQAARMETFNEGLQQTIATLSSILAAQRVAPLAAQATAGSGTADAAPVVMRKTDTAPAVKKDAKEKP
jgi:hypothetical protein